MAQDKIKMGTTTNNMVVIRQPDEDLGWSFETTYTQDSTRVMSGRGYFTALFTVESLRYEASAISVSDARTILGYIAKGRSFYLHYWSPYYAAWRTDLFYVGKGSLTIGTLDDSQEYYSTMSFNMTGVNPIG